MKIHQAEDTQPEWQHHCGTGGIGNPHGENRGNAHHRKQNRTRAVCQIAPREEPQGDPAIEAPLLHRRCQKEAAEKEIDHRIGVAHEGIPERELIHIAPCDTDDMEEGKDDSREECRRGQWNCLRYPPDNHQNQESGNVLSRRGQGGRVHVHPMCSDDLLCEIIKRSERRDGNQRDKKDKPQQESNLPRSLVRSAHAFTRRNRPERDLNGRARTESRIVKLLLGFCKCSAMTEEVLLSRNGIFMPVDHFLRELQHCILHLFNCEIQRGDIGR